jgi:hypothetical protein
MLRERFVEKDEVIGGSASASRRLAEGVYDASLWLIYPA